MSNGQEDDRSATITRIKELRTFFKNLMEDNRAKIFRDLKRILEKYERPMVAKMDDDSHYDLWSIKDVEIAGRKRKEVYFAGLVIQSTYVGFYYMPIYGEAGLKKVFKEELLTTLKGKACFHIKKLDKPLLAQIREALEIGHKLYKKNGWV